MIASLLTPYPLTWDWPVASIIVVVSDHLRRVIIGDVLFKWSWMDEWIALSKLDKSRS